MSRKLRPLEINEGKKDLNPSQCYHLKLYGHTMRKRRRGMNRVEARKKGMEQNPIPIKKPVSNKQPSLISSTRKIKKAERTLRTHKYAVRTYFYLLSDSKACSHNYGTMESHTKGKA